MRSRRHSSFSYRRIKETVKHSQDGTGKEQSTGQRTQFLVLRKSYLSGFLCPMKPSPNETLPTVPGLDTARSLCPFSVPLLGFVVLCLLQVPSFEVGEGWTRLKDFSWQKHTSA